RAPAGGGVQQAAGHVGERQFLRVVIPQFVQAASAAAIAERLPLRGGHVIKLFGSPERLCLGHGTVNLQAAMHAGYRAAHGRSNGSGSDGDGIVAAGFVPLALAPAHDRMRNGASWPLVRTPACPWPKSTCRRIASLRPDTTGTAPPDSAAGSVRGHRAAGCRLAGSRADTPADSPAASPGAWGL